VPVAFASFWYVADAVRGLVPGVVRGLVPGVVRGLVPGLVRGPPPGVVSSLPPGLASSAVHTEEDQRDEREEDNQKYPCVGDGTGDPRRTEGDDGQHRLAPVE